MDNTPKKRGLFVVALTAVLLLALAVPAGAFPHLSRWWQYDLSTWNHSWKSAPKLVHADHRWLRANPDATDQQIGDEHAHLQDRYLAMHFHQAAGVQRGGASWFTGSHGYCTPHMSGYYAASRTLPCGTQVSVRAGGRYVIVTIEDRGPFVPGRILDLSPAAYKQLAPLGTGVVHVTATRLRG